MQTMSLKRMKAAAAIVSLLASAPLLALQPGTRTPDMMVNLQIDRNAACPVYGYAVNQQINADGSLSPFSIPEGYSLVITGLNWYNYVTVGDTRFEGRLSIQGTEAATIFADFRYDSGSSYQGGSVTGITDVVVKPGVALCYGLPAWSTYTSTALKDIRANVQGYLVKDRGTRGDDDRESAAARRSR